MMDSQCGLFRCVSAMADSWIVRRISALADMFRAVRCVISSGTMCLFGRHGVIFSRDTVRYFGRHDVPLWGPMCYFQAARCVILGGPMCYFGRHDVVFLGGTM